jgi:transmembrane sensor
MQPTDESDDMIPSEEGARLRKEAAAWVIRSHRGDLSPEDRRAFHAWRAQSPAHADMFRTVSSVWESPDLREAAAAAATAQPSLFNAKIRFRRRWPIPAVTAACILLLAIIGLRFAVDTRLPADHRTGAGERRTVELPDRSIATLNTDSAIALSFDETARRVRLLSGEAFFDIRHDAARPFIVEGSEAAVRAVGTAFVVRTEPDGDRVTVVQGAVEVGDSRGLDSPVLVTAGSQLRVKQGHPGRPYAVDVAEASAWLRGRLVVNGVPFEEVLEELRRYYPGTIVLWNRDIGNIQVTGTYNVNDPVGALALLIKTVPVSAIGLTDRLVILF